MSRDGWLPPGCTDDHLEEAYRDANPDEPTWPRDHVSIKFGPELPIGDICFLYGHFDATLEAIAAELWMAETEAEALDRIRGLVLRAMQTKTKLVQEHRRNTRETT